MNLVSSTDTQELPITSDEPDSAVKPKRVHAPQSLFIATELTEATLFLAILQQEPEIADLLIPKGIDSSERAVGQLLLERATEAFTRRQTRMGLEDSALGEVGRLLKLVKREYVDFRGAARVKVLTQGGRTALGLRGKVPLDRRTLIAQVRSTYRTAQQPEFQPVLASCGYTTAHLTDLLSDVAALEVALVASRDARGEAERATVERDEAVRQLRQWTAGVKAITRRVLQERPDLKRKLGM